jgi:hypothetical protein
VVKVGYVRNPTRAHFNLLKLVSADLVKLAFRLDQNPARLFEPADHPQRFHDSSGDFPLTVFDIVLLVVIAPIFKVAVSIFPPTFSLTFASAFRGTVFSLAVPGHKCLTANLATYFTSF